MIVGGFDLSMTGAGVVYVDTLTRMIQPNLLRSKPGPRSPTPAHKGRKPDRGIFPVWDRAARIDRLAAQIAFSLPNVIDLAVIEAPSFASVGGFPHERSGLWWKVVTHLAGRCQVVEVAPSSRAKYATGSGSAGKASVVAAMVDRYSLSYRDDNLVDATALAAMGCRHLGYPLETNLPASHLDAMNGVLWPSLKGSTA